MALNIESRGYSVSVYNRSSHRTEEMMENEAKGKNVVATYSPEEFVHSLEKPRKILLMVQAGTATDATIESLKPYLEKGDILIDGGNTHFPDTMRRNKELSEAGLHFIGAGVSGGEEGALTGPSIMPGGQKKHMSLLLLFSKQSPQKLKVMLVQHTSVQMEQVTM
ncbi:NAD(P)-binding domain-containing protein [Bacillus sp. N9]